MSETSPLPVARRFVAVVWKDGALETADALGQRRQLRATTPDADG